MTFLLNIISAYSRFPAYVRQVIVGECLALFEGIGYILFIHNPLESWLFFLALLLLSCPQNVFESFLIYSSNSLLLSLICIDAILSLSSSYSFTLTSNWQKRNPWYYFNHCISTIFITFLIAYPAIIPMKKPPPIIPASGISSALTVCGLLKFN